MAEPLSMSGMPVACPQVPVQAKPVPSTTVGWPEPGGFCRCGVRISEYVSVPDTRLTGTLRDPPETVSWLLLTVCGALSGSASAIRCIDTHTRPPAVSQEGMPVRVTVAAPVRCGCPGARRRGPRPGARSRCRS